MIKLLMSDSQLFTEDELNELRHMGYELDIVSDRTALSPEQAAKYEVVMAYGLLQHTPLEYFKNLKMVHSVATGVEAMPVEELAKRGIPLYKGKDLYSIPMTEWVICKLLEALKHSREMACRQREHVWRRRSWAFTDGTLDELFGKRVLIVGTGDIGRCLAGVLRKFEVASLTGINTNGRAIAEFDRCTTMEGLATELPQADIVVLTCPLTAQTFHLIDREKLSLMLPDAILVNVSRGKLVDEKAITQHLQAGRLRFFITDVAEVEPLPKESPLWEMENVIITPHNSFITTMRPRRMAELLIRNLRAYAEGQPMEALVDYQKGY